MGIQNDTYLVKYINAIYFALTTMLTIGYGDISPESIPEKLITIFIEIVGSCCPIQASLLSDISLTRWVIRCRRCGRRRRSWRGTCRQ